MLKCTSWCIKTPFHGAQTTLYCCLDDKIEHESGNYYSDCAQKPASPQGQDAEAAKKLWELSEKMVGLKNEWKSITKKQDTQIFPCNYNVQLKYWFKIKYIHILEYAFEKNVRKM